MVAITVVLAAVVFVLVSNLSDTGDQAPNVGFSKNEGSDRINVVSADAGLDWSAFTILADKDVAFGVSEAPDTNAASGTAVDLSTGGATSISAGGYIELCGGDITPTSTPQTNVNIRIVHVETNTQVYETDFATIAGCPTP